VFVHRMSGQPLEGQKKVQRAKDVIAGRQRISLVVERMNTSGQKERETPAEQGMK
jgi:hypothetical protein